MTLLAALAAGILSAQTGTATIAPQSSSGINDTVAIVTLTTRETGRKGLHAAIAVSGFGDVVGQLLTRKGAAVCTFRGYTDGACVTLTGCVSGTACP